MDGAGTNLMNLETNDTTPSGASVGSSIRKSNAGDLGIVSNNVTSGSGDTNGIFIETGNNLGTGDTGDIQLRPGLANTGTQGKIKLVTPDSAPSVGDVWTATNTDGSGEWTTPSTGGSAVEAVTIQLGAGTTIAAKVAASPTGGTAGLTIVDGTNGSVDSEFSAPTIDDLVIIHSAGKMAVGVEAVGEGPIFSPTIKQKIPSSSASGFAPGTMETNSAGTQTIIRSWNISVGNDNQRTWTTIKLVPILT